MYMNHRIEAESVERAACSQTAGPGLALPRTCCVAMAVLNLTILRSPHLEKGETHRTKAIGYN